MYLSPKEYDLLYYLAVNQGRVVSRIEIGENVWGINFDTGTNYIDVYINYLRKKIDSGFEKKLIHTVRGVGYVLKFE
ncbi:MAG: winged helix-turn-helix domain-containing protein [Candidatus Kryptonium sp.]